MFVKRRLAHKSTLLAEQRSVSGLEFAIVAPAVLLLSLAVYDLSRALIIWEELNNAAEAIVESAEKLSVTTVGGQPATTLNIVQIQAALSTIYAEIPGLQWGSGKGNFNGTFGATLSSIVYLPWCPTTSGCAKQSPNTLWSAFLTEGDSTSYLLTSPASALQRQCNQLTPVAHFPDNSTQLSVMVTPQSGSLKIPLTPQLVADVQYNFTSSFPLFSKLTLFTLWASATLPAPLGGPESDVAFDSSLGQPPSVLVCTNIPPP
jgi:hypothetical protein